MKLFKKLILVVLLIVIVAGGFCFQQYNNNLKPISKDENLVEFTIQNGETVSTVVKNLAKQGLIHDNLFTKIYIKLHHVDNILVNQYMLSPSYSLSEIFDILQNGNHENLVQESMTIIEGTTIQDVAEELSLHLDMSAEDILNTLDSKEFIQELQSEYSMISDEVFKEQIKHPLEGYFVPETYSLAGINKDLKTYVKLMLDPLQTYIDQHITQIEEKNMSIHDFIALVSVVESEAFYEKDKGMIAGVFYNRLRIGMPLQSDSTVLYALNKKDIYVSYEDLQVNSLYNTYLVPGVPVGPVCLSSIKTLDACLNPNENNFYFFFATKDGTVLYSVTYEEHQKICQENKWY